MPPICQTARLSIRPFSFDDVEFIIRLLNEKSFIENITDKQVRTISDAKKYLKNGPMASYKNYGYGLYAVLLENNDIFSAETSDEKLIGMCGLLKRPELDYPDLGYAFLPEFCGKGYAVEAAQAVLKNEVITHSLKTVLAVTSLTNQSSHNLLKKINFSFIGTMQLYGEQSNVYQYKSHY